MLPLHFASVDWFPSIVGGALLEPSLWPHVLPLDATVSTLFHLKAYCSMGACKVLKQKGNHSSLTAEVSRKLKNQV